MKKILGVIGICFLCLLCWQFGRKCGVKKTVSYYEQNTRLAIVSPREFQKILARLGYLDPNDIDGKIGKKTIAAWECAFGDKCGIEEMERMK